MAHDSFVERPQSTPDAVPAETNLRPENVFAETRHRVDITLEQAETIQRELTAALAAAGRLVRNREKAAGLPNDRANLDLAEGWDETAIEKAVHAISDILEPKK